MEIRDKDWWDKFWKDPAHNFGNPNKSLLKYAKNFISGKKELVVLDLAAADGRYLIPLAKMGYKVFAVDFSRDGTKRLKSYIKKEKVKIKTKRVDVSKLKNRPLRYDIIFCSGCLEELKKETQKKMLKKMMNWTKPRGMNIIRYCLEVNGRGKLIKEGFIKSVYEEEGWKILKSSEDKKLKISKANLFEKEKIRAGTLISIKPTKKS